MAYVEPASVLSPKASIRSVQIIHNTGPEGWSAARIHWEEDTEALGLRWNGGGDPGIGNPQSRGNPTWFIVPPELRAALLREIEDLEMNRPGGLLDSYRAMAADDTREREAIEWTEGLIGDASTQR